MCTHPKRVSQMLARSSLTCPFDGAPEPGKLTFGFAFVPKPLLQFLPVDILIRLNPDSLIPTLWILPVDGRCETIHNGLRGRNNADLPNADIDDRTILVFQWKPDASEQEDINSDLIKDARQGNQVA